MHVPTQQLLVQYHVYVLCPGESQTAPACIRAGSYL